MTDDEIDSTPAGRLMDIQVARMMGWRKVNNALRPDYMAPPVGAKQPPFSDVFKVPHYSTNMEKAWLVLEAAPKGWAVGVRRRLDGQWQAEYGVLFARADKGPLAICRAALKAVAAKELV